jgi:hypothetical protein
MTSEGAPFGGVVATFNTGDVSGSTASDFSATIAWGDNSTTPGQVTASGSNGFTVQGMVPHTYSEETPPGKPNTVTVTVKGTGGSMAVGTATATVGDAALSASGLAIAPIPSTAFKGSVANFSDANTAAPLSDFTALIDWGDGTTPTTGTVASTVQGGFSVSGMHIYPQNGTFITTTSITDVGGKTALATGNAVVSVTPTLTATAAGTSFAFTAGIPFTGTVATFTETNPAAATTASTAVIDWGDGRTSSGTVSGPDSNRVFTVSGTHLYPVPAASPYNVKITITDPSGQVAMASSTALASGPLVVPVSFSGGLDPGPENGPLAAHGMATNTNRPTFSGTTNPFSNVQLFSRLAGVDATLPLGQVIADATGRWSLTTNPLADGIYTITAIVIPPTGPPSGVMPLAINNGQVIIDTVPPTVVSVSRLAGGGRVQVVFRDDLSGLNTSSLMTKSNYTLAGPHGLAVHPTSVLVRAGLPSEPARVILVLPKGHRTRHAVDTLRIAASGILDNAGNTLRGNFFASIN